MARRVAPRPIGANPEAAELSGDTRKTNRNARPPHRSRYKDEADGLSKTAITRRKAIYNTAGFDLYGWAPQTDDPTDAQLCGFPVTAKEGTVCRNSAGAGTLHPGVGYCWHHQITAARESGIYLADVYRGQRIDPEDALERQLAHAQGAVTILTSLIAEMPLAALESTPEGRIAMRMLREERDRVVKTAKSMIDMDFRERQTGLAEKLSQPIVAVLEGVLADLRLDRTQQAAVGPIVRKHLALLEGGRLPVQQGPGLEPPIDVEVEEEPGEVVPEAEAEDDHASG